VASPADIKTATMVLLGVAALTESGVTVAQVLLFSVLTIPSYKLLNQGPKQCLECA